MVGRGDGVAGCGWLCGRVDLAGLLHVLAGLVDHHNAVVDQVAEADELFCLEHCVLLLNL